jgi:alpha-glucuronidase
MNSKLHPDFPCIQINTSFAYLRLFYIITFLAVFHSNSQTPGGYDLWLGYAEIEESSVRSEYVKATNSIFFSSTSNILQIAENELVRGFDAMLGRASDVRDSRNLMNTMWVAKKAELNQELKSTLKADFERIGKEGFIVKSVLVDGKSILLISANEDVGILYGVFKLLQLMKMQKSLERINIVETPKIELRMLNHWDNLDRTVERGYGGFSLWNWQKLPNYID